MLEYFTGIDIKLSLCNPIDSDTIKELLSELNDIFEVLFSVSLTNDFLSGTFLISFSADGDIDISDTLSLEVFTRINKIYKCEMHIEKCIKSSFVYNKTIKE